jgi:hypothetical protein
MTLIQETRSWRDCIKGSVPPWSGYLLNVDNERLLEPYESPMIARTDWGQTHSSRSVATCAYFSLVSAASAGKTTIGAKLRPIRRSLTDRETRLYLREIKREITYFGRSFQRAHVSVDIAGCRPDEALRKVKDALTLRLSTEQNSLSEQPLASMHY